MEPRFVSEDGDMIGTFLALLAIASPAPPLGIPIHVMTTAEYDTQASSPGEAFTFVTTVPTALGEIDVPAGTPGTGVVVAVVAGQGFRGGSISFVPEYLHLANGRKIAIRALSKNGHFDERVRAHFFPGVMTTTQNLTVKRGVRFDVVTADAPPPIPPDILRNKE